LYFLRAVQLKFFTIRSCLIDLSLKPYIEQIDEICSAVNSLEQSAYKLDAYSKQLGTFPPSFDTRPGFLSLRLASCMQLLVLKLAAHNVHKNLASHYLQTHAAKNSRVC